jgi:hypothetical protein
MPQEYKELKCYTYLCYLDSKLEKINGTFIEKYIIQYFIKQNYALLLREHGFIRENVWNEFNESMKQERYLLQNENYKKYIEKQISNGLNEKTDSHCACGLLIRNMKHEKINEINETWYKHIQECGIQDQISFFFIKQLFSEYIYPFKENPFHIENKKNMQSHNNNNNNNNNNNIKYNRRQISKQHQFNLEEMLEKAKQFPLICAYCKCEFLGNYKQKRRIYEDSTR